MTMFQILKVSGYLFMIYKCLKNLVAKLASECDADADADVLVTTEALLYFRTGELKTTVSCRRDPWLSG